ncbi:hypothetical protein SAMN05421739_11819 [Pontibacter chinhatensis]|uniref:Uncharacterized protein n=1 Tax=Pontibacter chinhatensis TaxID=1436961 RepID=A0A1I2ZSB4_9BACT|nr:hypothetical protein SAMN05421739_11819 [Pontibacter chinhatensis]
MTRLNVNIFAQQLDVTYKWQRESKDVANRIEVLVKFDAISIANSYKGLNFFGFQCYRLPLL